MWFDSHCHLPYDRLDEPAVEIQRARDAGVGRMVTVGTDRDQSAAALDVARAHDDVWATIGLHPHDAKEGLGPVEDLLGEALAAGDGKVVAVGECGLDYHYDHSPRDTQRDVFAAQVALANHHELALVIHSRDAFADTFAVLDDVGVPDRTVFHCFTGGPADAEAALERGCWLSFSGIVTFPSATDLQAAAALCPLDRVLVETDAPYLAPVPHRGKPNRPALVTDVGVGLAAAMSQPVEAIEEATFRNASKVFGLG